MERLIECGTCGYPLLPEERKGLVEIDGKMCKPLADHSEHDLDMVTVRSKRKPLTDEEILKMWDDTRNDPIAPSVFCFIACVRHVERAHGIGSEE